MIDETLLTYLAKKYIPREPTHVPTAYNHWRHVKDNMQQPSTRNPIKWLLFRWIEARVIAYYREYHTLHRLGVGHTGPLVTTTDRSEVVFSNVEYYLIKPERFD